jgi:Transposase IS116/IS110/IS902 family
MPNDVRPVHYSRGTNRWFAIVSKAGNPRVRASLYMAAVVAKEINPEGARSARAAVNVKRVPETVPLEIA